MADSFLETQALHGVIIMSQRVPRNGVGEIAGAKRGHAKWMAALHPTAAGIDVYVVTNQWFAALTKNRLLCQCAREANERSAYIFVINERQR